MQWSTIEQLIRIAAYAGGSAYFGAELADGELFQSALGGLVAIVAFGWWMVREGQK